MNDLEIRSADLEYREDSESGYLEGIAVPYGQIANIGGKFQERFAERSMETEGTVWLYHQHKDPIGVVEATEERSEGFFIRAKLALSDLAKSVREQLQNGSLKSLSVGFVPMEHRDEDGVKVITRARLREVSVVAKPAYSLALVTHNREDTNDREPVAITKENAVDTPTASAAELTEVRGAVEELEQRFNMFTPAPVETEKVDTRSAAAFVKALASGDVEARESYERVLAHLNDEAQTRAYTGGTISDAPVKDAWVADLTNIFDSSSGVQARLFSTGTLPATGNNVEFAELLANTVKFEQQVNEGDDLAYGKVTLTTRTAPVKTYGGRVQLSRQAIERSTLPVLNRSLEALALAAGARKKAELRTAIASVVAARKAIATNGGVVVLGATLAAATADNWTGALIDAAVKYDTLDGSPEFLIVSASVFKKLHTLTVSGERVFSIQGDGNRAGTLSLPGLTGSLAGIPVFLDAGQAGDEAYFGASRAVRQYDSSLVSLQDENVVNLTKDFSVYRYGAIAAEVPQLIVPVKLAAS